jgi:hypothetical protein
VLGLAVFLLPLVPGWGQAQDPREVTREVEAAGQPPRDEGDLRRLRDELKEKLADIEKLKKKIAEAARDRAKEAQKKARELHKQIAEGRERGREVHRGSQVIKIEISGVKPDEIKDLVAKLKKDLPGKDTKVIVTVGGPSPTILFKGTTRDGQRGIGIELGPRGPRGPVVPGGERRSDSLEKKLDSVLRELEALRKELRGSRRPGASGGPGPSGGGRGFGGGFGGRPAGPAPGPGTPPGVPDTPPPPPGGPPRP